MPLDYLCMKKHILLVLLSCALHTSCSLVSSDPSKSIAVGETLCKNEVASLNFERARIIVDSLKSVYPEHDFKELVTFINNKELMYMFTEIGDDNILNAKVMLYVEEEKSIKPTALKYAINYNKVELVSKIVDTYYMGKPQENIIKYLKDNNYELFVKYVKSFGEIPDQIILYLIDVDDKQIQSKVLDFLNSNVANLKENLREALALRCHKDYDKVLMNFLNSTSTKIKGQSLKAGVFKSDSEHLDGKYYEYSTSIVNYNADCRKMLDCAIRNHNQALAKQTMSMFRRNMHIKDLGAYETYQDKEYQRKLRTDAGVIESLVGIFSDEKADKYRQEREEYNRTLVDHSYQKNKFQITYDWVDRDEAQKVLKSATYEGAFKKK